MTLKDKIAKARELRENWFCETDFEYEYNYLYYLDENITEFLDALEKCLETLDYLTRIGSETSTIVARNTLRNLEPSEDLTKERGE